MLNFIIGFIRGITVMSPLWVMIFLGIGGKKERQNELS